MKKKTMKLESIRKPIYSSIESIILPNLHSSLRLSLKPSLHLIIYEGFKPSLRSRLNSSINDNLNKILRLDIENSFWSSFWLMRHTGDAPFAVSICESLEKRRRPQWARKLERRKF
jgi:hypothetical protein